MSCVDLFRPILRVYFFLSFPVFYIPSSTPSLLFLIAHISTDSFLLTFIATVLHLLLPNFALPLHSKILFHIPPRREGKEKDEEDTLPSPWHSYLIYHS